MAPQTSCWSSGFLLSRASPVIVLCPHADLGLSDVCSIIEGIATVFVGLFCWWMVFDW